MFSRRSVTALAAVLCASCAVSVENGTLAESTDNQLLDVDDEIEMCGNGEGQSPIDLPLRIAPSDLPDLTFDYHESHISIANTGHTVQYSYDPGSTLLVGDDPYQLVQFHFHAHSEHSLDGFLTPMEMHLVHKNADEELLVVGALVVPGRHNDTLDLAAWAELPGADSDPIDLPDEEFNVSDLIPGGSTYRYTGSLTAPPCSGEVSWVVFRRPLVLAREQIEMFTSLHPYSAREVQPLGDRELVFGR
jgi:carbonic anhydrase